MHGSDHVLPADGALIHALATLRASDHVATFQQNTVDGGVHADPTQVLLQAGRHCSPVLVFSTTHPVLEAFLVLVQPRHPLHQLPLLTAALVGDEVASQDLLQLPHTQTFNVLQLGQVRQGGSSARDKAVL